MSAFSLQAPPKERQLAIDEYFGLQAGKQTLMQRNPNPVTPAVVRAFFCRCVIEWLEHKLESQIRSLC